MICKPTRILLIFAAIIIGSIGVVFDEPATAQSEVRAPLRASGSGPRLPHCVNDPAELRSIEETRKQNTKTAFKYRAIEAALQSDSDQELLTRLTYAETLAANCPEFENTVLSTITNVIGNRVAKRKGDVKGVVFQRDQFASSLNGYEGSKWREFLCPTDLKLWERAMTAIRATPTGNIPADAYNYYLFKHSSKFQVPEWAKRDAVRFSAASEIESCVKVFKVTFN